MTDENDDEQPTHKYEAALEKATDELNGDSASESESESEATESDANDADDSDIAYYECPHCGLVEGTESDVRMHVTQADDHKHKGRSGFSVSESVLAYNASGERVDVLQGGPGAMTKLSEGEISTELIPDDMVSDETEKQILRTALVNRQDPVNVVHRKVNNQLSDDEQVRYEKVDYVLKKTIGTDDRPDGRKYREEAAEVDESTEPEEPEADDGPKDLDEFTKKQRAVIEAFMENPARPWTRMSEDAGVSDAYPVLVFGEHEASEVTTAWNAPGKSESRAMLATWSMLNEGDDPTADRLVLPHGKRHHYDWPESYADATFAQRAIIDYVLAHGDDRPDKKVANDLRYPEGYAAAVREHMSDVIESRRPGARTTDASDGEKVQSKSGNASYSGPSTGLDMTETDKTFNQRSVKGTTHRTRLDDIEEHGWDWRSPTAHLPDGEAEPEPEADEEPESEAPEPTECQCGAAFDSPDQLRRHGAQCSEYAGGVDPEAEPMQQTEPEAEAEQYDPDPGQYPCPDCGKPFDTAKGVIGHCGGGACERPDGWEPQPYEPGNAEVQPAEMLSPEEFEQEMASDTEATDADVSESVGVAPADAREADGTLMPSTRDRQEAGELREEIERLRRFVRQGSLREESYAAGQYDALTEVLKLLSEHHADTEGDDE